MARMAALRAAKQALRRDIKQRVAALSEQEKQRQSKVVSQKVSFAKQFVAFFVNSTSHPVGSMHSRL